MAIKALNKKLTGQTTSGNFGPVPSGKEWVIKMVVGDVTSAGAAAELELVIDAVVVAITPTILSVDDVEHLVGGFDPTSGAAVKSVVIASDGQDVVVQRTSGGGFTWAAHMSYLERDIP